MIVKFSKDVFLTLILRKFYFLSIIVVNFWSCNKIIINALILIINALIIIINALILIKTQPMRIMITLKFFGGFMNEAMRIEEKSNCSYIFTLFWRRAKG